MRSRWKRLSRVFQRLESLSRRRRPGRTRSRRAYDHAFLVFWVFVISCSHEPATFTNRSVCCLLIIHEAVANSIYIALRCLPFPYQPIKTVDFHLTHTCNLYLPYPPRAHPLAPSTAHGSTAKSAALPQHPAAHEKHPAQSKNSSLYHGVHRPPTLYVFESHIPKSLILQPQSLPHRHQTYSNSQHFRPAILFVYELWYTLFLIVNVNWHVVNI